MIRYIIILCLFQFSNSAYSKTEFEIIEKEIKQLHNKTEIEKYWLKVHESDQINNSGISSYEEKIDLLNLYKVTILIDRFGYPTKELEYPAYNTPWLVWSHCDNNSLLKYTFPIILEGKKLKQIPQEFYPNYFIGGFLLCTYGFDMEFDNSFNMTEKKVLETTFEYFNNSKTTIKPNKVKNIISDFLKISNLSIKSNLGTWSFIQHKNKIEFNIKQLENGNWYLSTKLENGFETLRCLIKNNDNYKVENSFDLFYFKVNVNNKLEIIDSNNNIIKTSE